jgi:predicted nucleic acid-binding Zn ribbon protein
VIKSRDIKELLEGGSARLTSLRDQTRARSTVLAHVRAALSPALARAVASAGVEAGRLTIGVSGAHWATRLRYATKELRQKVESATGVEIHSVRIKVVQPTI